jgi:uncharacterized protein
LTALLIDRAEGDLMGTLLLAHGAGADCRHPNMTAMTASLVQAGMTVIRFDFAYMAERGSGIRRPPSRMDALVGEYAEALAEALAICDEPLLIGGKSMGSRVAARLASSPVDPSVRGVVAWGFPFHRPDRPQASRLPDLAGCRLPVLVLQGTRDPFGTRAEVEAMDLPPNVTVRWFEDGDHDLSPRKASGHSREGHFATAAAAVAAFAQAAS